MEWIVFCFLTGISHQATTDPYFVSMLMMLVAGDAGFL